MAVPESWLKKSVTVEVRRMHHGYRALIRDQHGNFTRTLIYRGVGAKQRAFDDGVQRALALLGAR